jgi:prophage regulatory protein
MKRKEERKEERKTGTPALPEAMLAINAHAQRAAGLAPDIARHQHDRRYAHGARGPPALAGLMLLRLPTVEQITGLRKSQIYDAIQRGVFPKPVHVLEGGRATAWVSAEIQQYLANRIAARDAVVVSVEATT